MRAGWPFVKVIDDKQLLELGNSYHNHKENHQDEITTLHVADVCRVDFFSEGGGCRHSPGQVTTLI